MRLAGAEVWSDEDVEAALAFSNNLLVSTVMIGHTVAERRAPGGRIVETPWTPTDLVYVRGDAAALAFATGRVRDGLAICGSLLQSLEEGPPALTLMQVIFGATLGSIAGTVEVSLDGNEATISPGLRRGFVSIDLAEFPLAERLRLEDLLSPAAFASPGLLDEIHRLQAGEAKFDPRARLAAASVRTSPFERFARTWKDERRVDASILMPRLVEYEGYIEALRNDQAAWGRLEFRAPLIDWQLLALFLGLHRNGEQLPIDGAAPGPSTRFLQDLAQAIASDG